MNRFGTGFFTGALVMLICVILQGVFMNTYDYFDGLERSGLEPAIEYNGKIYEEITEITEIMVDNTDIMMRYNHWLHDHPSGEPKLMCPQCKWVNTPEEEQMFKEGQEIFDNAPLEDVKPTYDQINADSEEIYEMLVRIKNSLINQQVRLDLVKQSLQEHYNKGSFRKETE